MAMRMTERAREMRSQAEREARGFNHEYVGTEHLLLAVLRTGLDVKELGLGVEVVASEIEKLVRRGPDAGSPAGALPMTPRAKKALEYAEDEARIWRQRTVDITHIFLGLLLEPDGVAGMVLRKLGVELNAARKSVFRIRLEQMRVVERAVRPVRTGAARKRKMREELLAHLEMLYEEEREALHDPDAALQEAARRFGDPAALARELDGAVPWAQRNIRFLERRFGWRAPEPAWRYLLRVAMQMSWLVGVIVCLHVAAVLTYASRSGWDTALWAALLPALAMVVIVPTDIFLLGMLYYRLRDAMWGVFGSRKSAPLGLGYGVLTACVVMASAVGFMASATGDWAAVRGGLYTDAAVAALVAVLACLQAHFGGRAEIEDTVWACLDVGPERTAPEQA